MKVIDQTPLQDANGEIGIVQRLQGTFKYGFEWYPEMQAQKTVIAHLSRALGKNYTAVRNQTLGASGITVPLALVGPAGIYAAYVTNARGTYQARGDSWGQMYGINFKPAAVNVLTRTRLFARALQAFIERQGVKLPKPVEPIILAANPGLHIESIQPITRIIMVDALERWAASLETAAPLLTPETAYELADRIVNPRPAKKQEVDNSEQAFEDNEGTEIPPELIEASPATPLPSQGSAKKRFLRMTTPQLALLGGMILVEICVLIGFAIVIFLNT